MSNKTLILLILLAALPLAMMAWLGWRISRVESLRIHQQLQRLMDERLADEDQKIQEYFARLQRELSAEVERRGEASAALRQFVRESPKVRQVIVLNRKGELIHPPARHEINDGEQSFLDEIQQMLADKDLVRVAFARRDDDSEIGSANEGWLAWYFGRGIHLMYWRRWADDRATVVGLSRARWMADVLALLPATDVNRPTLPDPTGVRRVCLVDSADQTIYQWGGLAPLAGAKALVDRPLGAPLSSWRLKYFIDEPTYVRSNQLPLVGGLVGMAAGLLGLVIVLYREYSRDMREATQRVNFVNQVSHELKTPLTNIRLYADLLREDLEHLSDKDARHPRSRVDVITTESQRLSRLIANVLTFARSERNQLRLHRRCIDIDQLVRDTLDRFAPALQAEGIKVDLATQAATQLHADPDAIEQILGNLFSNVLRYASAGAYMSVQTAAQQDTVRIDVTDRGPGIEQSLRQRIFQPFVRGGSTLSDTTGTGIGLSISRRLARLHGGDLRVLPAEHGAIFRLTLPRDIPDESATGRR